MPQNCLPLVILLFIAAFWPSGNAQEEAKIKLLFVGDIMMHGPQLESARIDKSDQYDFNTSFEIIRPLIQKADLAFGNLELTLPGHPPYRGWPSFRAPDTLATVLAQTGFDVITTANNHSNDGGTDGVIHTAEMLRKAGLYHTGTFPDTTTRKATYPLLIYKNGFRLAILNYTYGTDKKRDYPPTFVNKIDKHLIQEDICDARSLSPDFVIAIMHWGKEYKLLPAKAEEQLAEAMLGWGVDLIVGGHPHVIQPIRLYESPEKNKKLVAYSLGNFISNQQQPDTEGGVILEIELTKNKKQQTQISDHYYSTVYRYIQKKKNGEKTFYCIPITPYEHNTFLLPEFKYRERAKMLAFAEKFRQHLQATSDCPERKYRIKPKEGITSLFY